MILASGELSTIFFMMLWIVFTPMGLFLNHTSVEGFSITAKYKGPDDLISTGLFEMYVLKISYGHLRHNLFSNMKGFSIRCFSCKPDWNVFDIPSSKVTYLFPFSPTLKEKCSSFMRWWFSRPRKPKCWTTSHQTVLINALGDLVPS